jgi:MerR family transcriptional regulator, Zn(II)-responsive regulator of zntA
MRIGELASELGITSQAVRFYERAGLLKEPARSESGYRQYGADDLKRLRFIRQAKALGFTLNEIGSMLRMHDAGHAPCSEVIAIAERHLEEVEAEIDRLLRFRRQLSSALAAWRKVKTRQVAGGAICELIERTFAKNDAGPGASRGLNSNARRSRLQRAPSPAAHVYPTGGAR